MILSCVVVSDIGPKKELCNPDFESVPDLLVEAGCDCEVLAAALSLNKSSSCSVRLSKLFTESEHKQGLSVNINYEQMGIELEPHVDIRLTLLVLLLQFIVSLLQIKQV